MVLSFQVAEKLLEKDNLCFDGAKLTLRKAIGHHDSQVPTDISRQLDCNGKFQDRLCMYALLHKMDIHSTRAMRGSNCWTDHQMLRSNVAFRTRQKHNRQGTTKPIKLNTATISTTSHRESFEQVMDSALVQWEENENSAPDKEWAALQQVVYNTAKTYLGNPDSKHQDWFNPNDQELHTFMSRRECCKPGALDPPLQHTNMPADCYKNTLVH